MPKLFDSNQPERIHRFSLEHEYIDRPKLIFEPDKFFTESNWRDMLESITRSSNLYEQIVISSLIHLMRPDLDSQLPPLAKVDESVLQYRLETIKPLAILAPKDLHETMRSYYIIIQETYGQLKANINERNTYYAIADAALLRLISPEVFERDFLARYQEEWANTLERFSNDIIMVGAGNDVSDTYLLDKAVRLILAMPERKNEVIDRIAERIEVWQSWQEALRRAIDSKWWFTVSQWAPNLYILSTSTEVTMSDCCINIKPIKTETENEKTRLPEIKRYS